MSALAIVHEYRYPFISTLVKTARQPTLRLATDRLKEAHPVYFQGQLTEPQPAADALWCLGHVVQSRFHIPAAMLAKILILTDPVVTCDGQQLRWEVFSSCCSMYARVDLLESGLDGEMPEKGTTNVDFQFAMRSALGAVRGGEKVGLEVGAKGVTLKRGADEVHERKVKLPMRWLKGFAEVQQFQQGMQPVAKADANAARLFLRGLPKANSKAPAWLVATPRGFRLAGVASPRALRLQGITRLRALEAVLPHLKSLTVYADRGLQHSTWVADCGTLRFCITLSAELWRGFSGEGQLLHQLTGKVGDVALPRLRSSLKWNGQLDPAQLAKQHKLTTDEMQQGLALLGSQGSLGFDQSTRAYFHRELPFDLSKLESLHPRLKKAKELLAEHPFTVEAKGEDRYEAYLHGSEVVKHRVQWSPDEAKCTCTWFNKHGGERGPCAHVLAVEMKVRESRGN
jgi:hypothetical protein